MGFVFGVIIGFVIGVVFCLILGACASESPAEHEHNWEVRGAHQMYEYQTYANTGIKIPGSGEPITVVLYRCADCNETTTEDRSGHWTYTQLSGAVDMGGTLTEKVEEEETTDVETPNAETVEPTAGETNVGTLPV